MHLPTINHISLIFLIILTSHSYGQLIINEGSNKNFNILLDEDGEAEDWIEILNTGNVPINLAGYSLADNNTPSQWIFPNYELAAHERIIVFCSGKDRVIDNPFHYVGAISNYSPEIGWNIHSFESSFIWDGTSNILLNVCAYTAEGSSANSIFYQTQTSFISSLYSFNDYNDYSCTASSGTIYVTRPNTRFNEYVVGNGTLTNSSNTYPAPYGNSRKCSRHNFLYRTSELLAAGMSAGPIQSIGWNVAETVANSYTKIEIAIKHVDVNSLTNNFEPHDGEYFHTNFRISSSGETIRLYNPQGTLIDELLVHVPLHSVSIGRYPDGGGPITYLSTPTPGSSNTTAEAVSGLIGQPVFSVSSGVYSFPQQLTISSGTLQNAEIYYTTNGDEPTQESTLYNGETISIQESTVLRARAFAEGFLPSQITAESYLFGVSHTTPIVSVIIDNEHLYGFDGIFDHWEHDWERYAQMAYFDSTTTHELVFRRNVAMQIDGGAGGSRYHPQHSFRLEMGKSELGETDVLYPVLSNRPERTQYNRLYFRNGSNYWLRLPYKDACLVELMVDNTKSYYSAMRPVSVYLNGEYFGLYEMREKLDKQFYETYDSHETIPMDILSLSVWNHAILKATEGNTPDFFADVNTVGSLDPQSPDFINEMNSRFDLKNMTDYVIGQSWISNFDWPYNNIKLHRSLATDNRWRFSTVDLELSLNPEGTSNCQSNGLFRALTYSPNLYLTPWRRCMQNTEYFEYFVNRFADLMNTNYRPERLIEIEERYYEEWKLEMPKEYERWTGAENVEGWMNGFYARHIELQEELLCKTETVYDQVENTLNLEGQFDLTLNILPEGAGVIHLNTITPTEYPWTGIYYNGIPVQLTAEANDGYEFMYWIDNSLFDDTLDAQWAGAIDLNEIGFTAVFETTVGIDELKTAASHLRIYPNPTKGYLYLENNQRNMAHWEIYTAQGQLVSQSNNTYSIHQQQIDVSDYHVGLYFIKITYSDGRSENRRWVKS
jgi:hypothetical protein